jgi:hypothetical protein
MKSYEFNSWVEFCKGAFPNFNPTRSEITRLAWQKVLQSYSLDEAKNAITQYVVDKSAKFEPQPKEIAELLKANKSYEVINEPVGEIRADEPEKRFSEDVKLGVCRHNLYIYKDAHKLVLGGVEWDEALRTACRQRFIARGCKPCDYEFPSNEDLRAKGLAGVKAKASEAQSIVASFIRQWCQNAN